MSIDRRAFLRGMASGALALPLLQTPWRAFAQGDSPYPRRLIVFYQPNGTKRELCRPPDGSTEFDWTPGPLLSPLNHLAEHLVLFDGIDMTVAGAGPGGPHQRGMACVLTGQVITEGDYVGGDGRRAGWAGGPSIDQYAAGRLSPGTPLSTLELGVRVQEAVPRGRIIYRGVDQPVPPENDPLTAYARIFGPGGEAPDPGVVRQRLLRRRSVLDAVRGDFAALNAKVAAEDRVKLEQHADALRALERRLEAIAARPDTCRPDAPSSMDAMLEETFGQATRAQIDLMVNALACDVTRFASLQCSTSVNALRFTFLGVNDQQAHSLSHAGDGNALMQVQWERMLLWYSEQFAYLLSRLAAVPEGDGTLLDNTLVLWVNEISRGNTHSHVDMPFVLAGGKNMGLRTGRYLKYAAGTSHNDLLVSILNLLGLAERSFGHPEYCTGPLVGLV